MRYCGNCGNSFDPATLTGRTCPSCGAAINPTGDIAFSGVWDGAPNSALESAQAPTQAPHSAPAFDSFSASPTAPAFGFGYRDPQSMTVTGHKSHPFRLGALMALVALALLLVFGSALLLNNVPGRLLPSLGSGGNSVSGSQTTVTAASSSPGAQASPTGGSLSGGPLVTPAGSSTAGSPTPSASVSVTPTPEGSPMATPEPGQPALMVVPARITIGLCLGSSTQFTVANTGDGVMTWSATGSRTAYKLSPQSGSLDSGQKQTVTVSGISASGSVTVAAPGAADTPQTVTITCNL